MSTAALVVYLQTRQQQLAREYYCVAQTESGRAAIKAVDQELQRELDKLPRLQEVA